MRLILHILRMLFLPRWLTRPAGRGLRRVAYRVTQVLFVAGLALFVFRLWQDATYNWPVRGLVRDVARIAGIETADRDALIATLRRDGFRTLAAGMTRGEVRRVFGASMHTALKPTQEVYWFNFAGAHEFAFYLDYDTADRLVSAAFEHDFYWRRPPEPLALRPRP